jgi:hypothetical protein
MTSLSPSEPPVITLTHPQHNSLKFWLSLAGASVFFHALVLWAVLPWLTQMATDSSQTFTAVEIVELPDVQTALIEDLATGAIAPSPPLSATVPSDLPGITQSLDPVPELAPIESEPVTAPEDKPETVLSPIYNPTVPPQEFTPSEPVSPPIEPNAAELSPSTPLATTPLATPSTGSDPAAPLPSAPLPVPNLQPNHNLPAPPVTGAATNSSMPVDDNAIPPQDAATSTAETSDLPTIDIPTEQTFNQLMTSVQVISTLNEAGDRPETLPSPTQTEQVFNPDPAASHCLITPDALPLFGQAVDFKIVVQPDGHVADAIPQPSDHPLNQAYVELAACILEESWQFTPATSGSEAVMSDDLIISITVDRV